MDTEEPLLSTPFFPVGYMPISNAQDPPNTGSSLALCQNRCHPIQHHLKDEKMNAHSRNC
uniref:Uncharacterized protein MANES_06G155300 n=1 Tax=Rhizophora mucronata TaxID=61149 RepID=A0A2P2Q5J0_RHIMU